MDSTALLVVDVQDGAVVHRPHRIQETIANIASLIEECRSAGVEVIHVQHDGRAGEEDEPGTPGWQIHAAVAPTPTERVIRKAHNSAFRDTELRSYLASRGIERLIVVGIQTEYCVDTTCRVAFEHGFEVIVPEGTNTTWDNGDVSGQQIFELVNRRILDGRFARLLPVHDVLAAIRGDGRFTDDSGLPGDSA